MRSTRRRVGSAQPEVVPGREVTLALVRYRTPLAAASLPRAINKETELVAASPAYETARLLTVFGAGVDLIRAFALLLVAASTLMLFVALAQALDERRYDLAIMRALGASRAQVATVLLAESLVLAAAGTRAGPGDRAHRARRRSAGGCRRPRRWPPRRAASCPRSGPWSRWRWPRV